MKALTFSINGKMAHFRKYYSNSTALSYMLPPVTTVKGILAGLLGIERDQYYGLFSNEKCRVAIEVTAPIKKQTHTMNLLKVESLNDLNGYGKNRTQNDTEFIFPKDIRQGLIRYQIRFWHEDEKMMNALGDLLCGNDGYYRSKGISLALGSAQCQGFAGEGSLVEIEKCEASQAKQESISFSGAVVKDYVKKIDIGSTSLSIVKEETITEFDENRCLTLSSKKDILVNIINQPIKVNLHENVVYYRDVAEEKNFMFIL